MVTPRRHCIPGAAAEGPEAAQSAAEAEKNATLVHGDRGGMQRLPQSGVKYATESRQIRAGEDTSVACEMQNCVDMILRCLYIDTPDPAFLSLEPRYQAGFLDAEELDAYVAQPEYGLTERFVRRELAMGHECFAIREGRSLATYGWYSTTPTHFTDDLSVRFGRQWVYMYAGFTPPAYRGQRLHAFAMTLVLSLYRARGYRGLVSIVQADNDASLKSCARMGYRQFGTIYTARPGRLLQRRRTGGPLDRVFVVTTPGCRAFGFQLARTPIGVDPTPAPAKAAVATSDAR
jgi:hypothetical protein